MTLLTELKRRNVIRVAVFYLVVSWLILQVADIVFGVTQLPDWSLTLVAVLLALGFFPTVIFAWVFELTPEGVKRETEIDRSQSITQHTARKLDLAVIVLIVMAMGLFSVDRFFFDRAEPLLSPNAEGPQNSPVAPVRALTLGVAVLPFDNLSPDPDNAFFTSGVHEDVLTYLSRVADIRVISRTSVEVYAESALSLPDIGRELGVSHVVEGSVRRAGDRIRVTVQLIDAATDGHIWSENYDRTLSDIFAIQTEIAQTIVGRLEAELTEDEVESFSAIGTTKIDAYDLLIRGRELVFDANFRLPIYLEAAALIRRAVALDPDYLLAWVHLVEVCGQVIWVGTEAESADCRVTIERALIRTQELAPDSVEAQIALGIYRYRVLRDNAGAVEVLGPAVAARPNDVTALTHLAWAGRRIQLWDTAIEAMRRALAVDPANRLQHRSLIEVLFNATDYEGAIEATTNAMARFPDDEHIRIMDASFRLEHVGDVTNYREMMLNLSPQRRRDLGLRVAVDGLFSSSDEALSWVGAAVVAEDDLRGQFNIAYYAALIRWVWGDDQASMAFESALKAWEQIYPSFDDLPSAISFHSLLLAWDGNVDAARQARNRALALLEDSDDVLEITGTRWAAAQTLAVSGDAEAGWQELVPLIGEPGGPTEWLLYLDHEYRKAFAEARGYQAMAARLCAEPGTSCLN